MVFACRAGYGSESEADEEAATVSLPNDLGRVNRASTKSAVKLQEIGPRMTLQLMKVEEGLCSGGVIFSEYGMFFDLTLYLSFFCGGKKSEGWYALAMSLFVHISCVWGFSFVSLLSFS